MREKRRNRKANWPAGLTGCLTFSSPNAISLPDGDNFLLLFPLFFVFNFEGDFAELSPFSLWPPCSLAESESYMRATTPFAGSSLLRALSLSRSALWLSGYSFSLFAAHFTSTFFLAEKFSSTCATVSKSSCRRVLGAWSRCRLAFLCLVKKDEAMSENLLSLSVCALFCCSGH